jgi:transcriptional regulator with XRE-family HTH domain
MIKTISFDEFVAKTTTPQIRAKAAARTRELLAEMLVAEVRALAGKSQRELAEALGIKQPSVAKMEAAGEMQISTLRKIINALGGELEIRAKMPGGDVSIKLPKPKASTARKTKSHSKSSSRRKAA